MVMVAVCRGLWADGDGGSVYRTVGLMVMVAVCCFRVESLKPTGGKRGARCPSFNMAAEANT